MRSFIAVLILIAICTFSDDVRAQSLFLWGNVKWASNNPAIGIEIRLVRDDKQVRSTVYTDRTGSYAFFGIEGRPSDYVVVAYSRGSVIGQIRVPAISVGGQVPEMRLTSRMLRISAVATPKTVAPGQRTVLTVTVKDENGRPVPDATTTISAGGGKFLGPAEPFNPKDRLHGPYKTDGQTDAGGLYETSWVCNPCARAYGLRVESGKDGYILSAFDLTININQ
jgi:hypothetical protein